MNASSVLNSGEGQWSVRNSKGKKKKKKTSLGDSEPQPGPQVLQNRRSRNRNGKGRVRGSKGDQRHGTTSVGGEMSLQCGRGKTEEE